MTVQYDDSNSEREVDANGRCKRFAVIDGKKTEVPLTEEDRRLERQFFEQDMGGYF
jgi:hypothetical protein